MNNFSSDSSENPLDEWAARVTNNLAQSQNVDLSNSASEKIEGGQIRMQASAARAIKGHAVHMEGSAAGLLHADVVEMDDSAVGFIAAQDVSIQDSTTLGVFAQHVEAEQVNAFFFFSGRTDGKVEAILTPNTALIAGVGFGLSFFVAKTLISALWPFRRRNRS